MPSPIRVMNPADLEIVPLDSVVRSEINPRLGDVDSIRQSLRDHGQHRAAVVHRSTRRILVGNHMHLGMEEEGWTELLVYWVDDDERESIRRMLADNATSDKATNDEELLVQLFRDFKLDQDTFRPAGFSATDVEDLFAFTAPPPTLGDLEKKYGDPDPSAFWPVIRFKVPDDVHSDWLDWVSQFDDERAAFAALMALRV